MRFYVSHFIKLYKKMKHKFLMSLYDDWTICEFYRKKGAKIGKDCRIYRPFYCDEPFLIEIGDHVNIARGVTLATHDGASWVFRKEKPFMRFYGKIVIEDNCFIGADSMILPGVRIRENSIIGAKSVVINDVPPGSLVLGVPARVFSTTKVYKEKCLKERAKLGLDIFDYMFEGLTVQEVEKLMNSKAFIYKLREHLAKIYNDA